MQVNLYGETPHYIVQLLSRDLTSLNKTEKYILESWQDNYDYSHPG